VPLHLIGRLSVGFGPVMPSAQEGALATDGYAGGRWLFMLDGVGMLGRRWGLGGFLAGGLRSVSADNASAKLSDKLFFVGPEAMLLAGDGSCRFPLVGRVGYAGGAESLGSGGRWQSAPALGLEAGLLCLRFPVGAAAGVLFAPAGAPGDQGRAWNMGSFHVSIVFHFEK
jgi:hypothetical protein